jgi:hypothetical protein
VEKGEEASSPALPMLCGLVHGTIGSGGLWDGCVGADFGYNIEL